MSFRISRHTEDLAETLHALSQRLVALEQRLGSLEEQLQELRRQPQADPAELEGIALTSEGYTSEASDEGPRGRRRGRFLRLPPAIREHGRDRSWQ